MNSLEDAERVANYLIEETQHLFGRVWVGSRVEPITAKPINFPALNFLNIYTLRQVSLRVNRALIGWAEGRYNLTLQFCVPTPLEVLKMQAQGRRLVSIIDKAVGYRSPYQFTIHDLEHADRFFFNSELFARQVSFFSWIYDLVSAGHFIEFQKDVIFLEKFNYLVSDMNSHPAHMMKYLRSILLEYYLRCENKEPQDQLSESLRSELDAFIFGLGSRTNDFLEF